MLISPTLAKIGQQVEVATNASAKAGQNYSEVVDQVTAITAPSTTVTDAETSVVANATCSR